MPRTILITGFGPFPGAPFNPTEELVASLARERQTSVADVKLVPHIFRTSYAAVDRDLGSLLRDYKPNAILMFGLASRTRHLRIETTARNAVAAAVDADHHLPISRIVVPHQPSRLPLRTPALRLLAVARTTRVPAALSHDAGRYLCNYLCWRATEAVQTEDGPGLAAFIHVPLVRRGPLPAHRIGTNHVTMADLVRAGRGFLRVIACAMQR